LVDRVDRIQLQQATNFFRGALFVFLGVALVLDWVTLPWLFVIAFLLGVAETLYDNAAFALLPAIVVRDKLEQANGYLYTTQTVTNEFVGPSLGGTLFAWLGGLPFLLSGAAYALSALLIRLLRRTVPPQVAPPVRQSSVGRDIVDGLRWFWSHRLLHVLGIKAGIEHACWAATSAVFVLVASERLGLDAAGFGILLASGAVGGVIGSLTSPPLSQRLGTGHANTVSMVLQVVGYFGIALSTNVLFVAAMLGLLSFAGALGSIVGISFRQAIIPTQLMGRVSSAFRFYAIGAMAFGAFAGGLLARNFGLLAPYWASGAVILVTMVIMLPLVNNQTMNHARQTAQPTQP